MDNSYISQLPLEIAEKITLLISDHRTMKAWLKYLPIVKNIQSVEKHRKSLRKIDFMKNAKCRCWRCWRKKCRGAKHISYFRIHPGDILEPFNPSHYDFESDDSDSTTPIFYPNYTDWEGIHRCRECHQKLEWAICICDGAGFYIDDESDTRCSYCHEIDEPCDCDRSSDSDSD